MKISHSLVVILTIFSTSMLYAQDKKGYHLVWADEFSGERIGQHEAAAIRNQRRWKITWHSEI